jgi:hypothetical protein
MGNNCEDLGLGNVLYEVWEALLALGVKYEVGQISSRETMQLSHQSDEVAIHLVLTLISGVGRTVLFKVDRFHLVLQGVAVRARVTYQIRVRA